MSQTMLNVYDLETRRKSAVLQNAYNIIETHELNQIYSLSFTMPSNDEKVSYCQPRHFVRWGDDGELYRIKSIKQNDSDTGTCVYDCEHVITTLCDNLLFGSYSYGGGSIKTAAVITWLLQKQNVQNWVLESCDFERKFEYGWEQENILNALYAIPKEFSTPYRWEFDTTVYPWKISLKAIDSSQHPEFYLRAKRNILSCGKSADFADICTRIYPLGYGEGVNQLNIKDVNDGIPYLQSPAGIVDQYGIVEKVLVDRRFENPESLKAYAQTMLDNLQTPAFSRSFDVTDLYPLTLQNLDNAEVGKICKLTEDDTIAYITKTVHQWDEPGSLQIELSTKATDVVSRVADLAERVRIESVYAQGATQLYQHSKDANATPEKGMTISLYFPSEMRQINKVLLKLSLKPFRSYSSATESAGATESTSSEGGGSTYTSTDGGGSTQTSSSGGGVSSSSVSQSTVSASITSGPSSSETTASGGAGSDIVTSKTALEGNTGYVEQETDKASLTAGSKILTTSEIELTSGYASLETEKTSLIAGSKILTTSEIELTSGYAKLETEDASLTAGSKILNTSEIELTSGYAELETNEASLTTGSKILTTSEIALTSGYASLETGKASLTAGSKILTTSEIELTSGYASLETNDASLTTGAKILTTSEIELTSGYAALETDETEDGLRTWNTGNIAMTEVDLTTDVVEGASTGEAELTTGSANLSISGSTDAGTFDITGHSTQYSGKSSTDGAKASIWMDNAGDHNHNLWAYTGEVTPPASANYKHSHAINYTGGALNNGGHSHGLGQNDHSHGMYHYHDLNLKGVGSHSHTFSLYGVGAHTHGVGKHSHSMGSHSHTVPAHSHLVNMHSHRLTPHKHTIADHFHTISKHKHTIDAHTHTLPDHKHTIADHLHTISKHKHTIDAHTHAIPDHGHTIADHLHTIGKHKHTIDAHTHTIPNHLHTIKDHLHTIGKHKHTIDAHTHTIPDHMHSIKDHLHTIGKHKHTIDAHTHTIADHMHNIKDHLHTIGKHKHTIDAHTHSISDHNHTIVKHRHFFTLTGHSHTIEKKNFLHVHNMEHTHKIELSGVGSHTHTFSIPDHTHSLNIPSHSHKVTINSHTHTVEIPAHTHEITAGIFESGNPSAFDIYVTGVKKATVSDTAYDGDITSWLLNSSNQVPRDSWIDVEVRPNDLAYVVSSVFVQGFVQSRGGGNY